MIKPKSRQKSRNLSQEETKFLKALNLCQSLVQFKRKPSNVPCEAIELLCEVAQEPETLVKLTFLYLLEVEKADQAIEQYARSIDNWNYGDCPFGVKDHCNILHFFLNITGSYQERKFFRGQDFTPELICEFLKDWKELDLSSLLLEDSR